jgi:hypothetical protein
LHHLPLSLPKLLLQLEHHSFIPSLAATIHFSALAFLGTYDFDEFIKLMLFTLFIMAEPSDQRSMRSRKPKVHFNDKIALPLVPEKPAKHTKPAKSTKPLAPPTLASSLAKRIDSDDVIEELCGQVEELDI